MSWQSRSPHEAMPSLDFLSRPPLRRQRRRAPSRLAWFAIGLAAGLLLQLIG